jgi:hypothetical protein
VPRLRGDDKIERVGRRRPGLERRYEDLHAAPLSDRCHPRVGLHANHLAPAIEEKLRRDPGTAPNVQHTSDVHPVHHGINSRGRVRRSRAVVLLSVVTERETAIIIHGRHRYFGAANSSAAANDMIPVSLQRPRRPSGHPIIAIKPLAVLSIEWIDGRHWPSEHLNLPR